jgi:NADH-quinone oxidoreductase subunit N
VYSLATIPVFIIFILVKRAANGLEQLSAFEGLYREKPWIAAALVVLLASLAGIPPTSGFLAKYQVFVLSIGQGYLFISIFAIIMAVTGVYYYFFVIREAYSESEVSKPVIISRVNAVLIFICTIAVVVLGIFWPKIL